MPYNRIKSTIRTSKFYRIFFSNDIIFVWFNIRYISKINTNIREYFDPPRNYTLQIFGKDKEIWTRINDKLLTKKEAEKLGEEYKNQGYEIYIS